MRIPRSRLVSLASGLLCLSSLSAGTAFAAGATGLPVIVRPCDAQGTQVDGPGYFVVTARPGTTTRLYALIGNKSHQRATVSIVPVDGVTGLYGGVSAQLASQPRHLVGRWMQLSTSKVTLGPNQGTVLSVTLRVPQHTHPGQYVGAVTAFVPANDTRRGRGFAFAVQTRLADDVVVTVPGPERRQFQPDGVSAQRRTVGMYAIAHIANTGSMLLKGWGYLWVWQQGRKQPILAAPLRLDTTLPHTTLHYPIKLGNRLRNGAYSYQLKVWWQGGSTSQRGRFRVQ